MSGSENSTFQHLFRSAAATSEINTAVLLFCVFMHQHRRLNTRHHSVLRGSRTSRERTITINLGKDSAKTFFFFFFSFQTAATVEAPGQQRVRTAKTICWEIWRETAQSSFFSLFLCLSTCCYRGFTQAQPAPAYGEHTLSHAHIHTHIRTDIFIFMGVWLPRLDCRIYVT